MTHRLDSLFVALKAELVLSGLDPDKLTDIELSNVHLLFEREECALPPASAVINELQKRGLL